MKTVFINGRFVAESEARISVADRGFLYGDGLFETLRVYQGRPAFWQYHWKRLHSGAGFLKLHLPYDEPVLWDHAVKLIEQNNAAESVLRINVSRGIGPRGYSIKQANEPLVVMSLHAAPTLDLEKTVRCVTATYRLPGNDPLCRFKTSNKLHQVIARSEADERGADDAMLLNAEGDVAETTSCNVFWVDRGSVVTPPVSAGILPGVTRSVVLEICGESGICCLERNVRPEALVQMEGVFLTSSVTEITEVSELDCNPIARSPVTKRLQAAYRSKIEEFGIRKT